MVRRNNPLQIAFPDTETYRQARAGWPEGFVNRCLERLWLAWDQCKLTHEKSFTGTKWSEVEQKERGIAKLHASEVLKLQSPDDLFICSPEVDEFESLHSSKAMPPRYDFAFELRIGNPRILFPVEAKIIEKPTSVSEICKDYTGKYIPYKGAPLSNVATLVGYLLSGKEEDTFSNIEVKISTKLSTSNTFQNRPHRKSTSNRNNSPKLRDREFTCHWLLCKMN